MKKRKKHPAATRALKAKPTFRGWRTTDDEEVERRRLRASIEPIHRSPAFADSASAEREKLRKEAQKVFSEADRKMRMSTLLAEGGFPLEALSPLGQAVELALKASAYSAGEDGAGSEEELSLALIQSRIIPAGFPQARSLTMLWPSWQACENRLRKPRDLMKLQHEI